MKKREQNFLEFIPVKSKQILWNERKNGLVQIIIKRNSIIDRIVRKFFNTPEETIIDLDQIGSFVWHSIDGKRNIYEISKALKDKFGEKIEPLNERLITYIKILVNNNFIKFRKSR